VTLSSPLNVTASDAALCADIREQVALVLR
jgi:hypothetical protein